MNAIKASWAFPGLHYFEDNPADYKLFFGRAKEIEELTEKILAENLTILFGRSGDGKTSLINAGLKQSLRDLGYFVVRARIFNTSDSPIAALYEAVEKEAPRNEVFLPTDWHRSTLWETFYYLRPTATNKLKPIILILDQFEELFTLLAVRKNEQENFIQQFADLVRGRLPDSMRDMLQTELTKLEPGSVESLEIEKLVYGSASSGVRVLLSLREDYLAFLDNLGERIPTVYHCRYRLPSLTASAAREAISNPPQQKAVLGQYAFHITPDAIEAMLKFLTGESSRTGRSEQVVGPPQLQVLCRELEERMHRDGRNRIDLNYLRGEKGMRDLLSHYYRGIRKKFRFPRFGWGPRKRKGLFEFPRFLLPVYFPLLAVRRLCEDCLITPGGNRNSRHEEEIVREIGVCAKDLDILVESRLLRREPRLNEVFYELSHDSLVFPLQEAGNIRRMWTMSAKALTYTLIVLFTLLKGVPYGREWYAIDALKRDLSSVTKGESLPEEFKRALYKAKKFASDSTAIAQIEKEYDRWRINDLEEKFLKLVYSHPSRADSVFLIFEREYPLNPRVSVLDDTLRQHKLQQVEKRYYRMVQTAFEPANLNKATKLLDSAFIAFNRDSRITVLQADLAKKRDAFQKQQQLLQEAERIRKQLLAAIRLQKPKSMVVKGDISGRMKQLELILAPDTFLQDVTIRLNGQVMRKNRSFRGLLSIPPIVQNVTATIQVTNNDGIEAEKAFVFEIDRTPSKYNKPQLLSEDNVKVMLKRRGFFDKDMNPTSLDFANQLHEETINEDKIVFDSATNLMWQQSGSEKILPIGQVPNYIDALNRQKYAGYDDWRLPTLEEAISLMELKINHDNLYIDPVFDQKQISIWTAEYSASNNPWHVDYYRGRCSCSTLTSHNVRAVR